MDTQDPRALADEQTSLQQAFHELQAAYQAEAHPAWRRRDDCLRQLADALLEHQQALVSAVSGDFGHRSREETLYAELFPSLQAIRHARKHLPRWMQVRRRGVSWWFFPARNQVWAQPLGVVGIVVPWNYPIYLAVGPLVAALAAGNRVMIRMSEATPRTGALLADVLRQALGDDVVRVINGPRATAPMFSTLPFHHLLFTGSTVVGRQVMAAAALNLTPVTLELGGKSPVLIADDADLERAAASIVSGKMLNAGQTCVAPDYVLVARHRLEPLIAALGQACARAYPRLAANPDLTAIINPQHYQRLQDWLEQARALGASIAEQNPQGEDLAPEGKMPLTLVWDCPQHCDLMQQEIFGPLLPLLAYDDFAQALAYVNARPRPLALYLFSDDAALIRQVLQQTVSGGVALNDTVLQVAQEDLPFGGVGASGMGQYHGYEGFLTFSKLKPVFRQHRLNGAVLLRPPFGRRIAWLLTLMLRK